MSVCQFKLEGQLQQSFFHHFNFTRFFCKTVFVIVLIRVNFSLFLRKNFKTTKPKNSSKHNIQTWKNMFHDFFLKKNNLTVLDDLAAVTRMTGGLNVGGNQTFPGPFYVRWATLSYSYIRLHCTVSDEFEHECTLARRRRRSVFALESSFSDQNRQTEAIPHCHRNRPAFSSASVFRVVLSEQRSDPPIWRVFWGRVEIYQKTSDFQEGNIFWSSYSFQILAYLEVDTFFSR